jgi:uncharacterized protein (TIGR00369 family)
MDRRGDLNNRLFALPGSMTENMGIRFVEADDGHVVAEMRGHTGARQPVTNFWIGEALEALAGFTAAVLTESLDEDRADVVILTHGATSRSVYFFATSAADSVSAEATWIRRGRTQAVVQVSVTDSENRELLRMVSEHHRYPEPYPFDMAMIENSVT